MNIKMEEPNRPYRYKYVDSGLYYWRGCVDGLLALFCCRILFR